MTHSAAASPPSAIFDKNGKSTAGALSNKLFITFSIIWIELDTWTIDCSWPRESAVRDATSLWTAEHGPPPRTPIKLKNIKNQQYM